MNGDRDCVFCNIVQGKIPSTKIYENQSVLGFKEISPQAPVHYLFIPKEHVPSFADLPLGRMNLMAEIYGAIREVTEKEGLGQKGFRTTMNTRRQGGQSVDHLHVHVLGGKQMGPDLVGA